MLFLLVYEHEVYSVIIFDFLIHLCAKAAGLLDEVLSWNYTDKHVYESVAWHLNVTLEPPCCCDVG